MRTLSLITLSLSTLALAACSGGKPPLPQLVLQPILYPDIAQNKLYGPSCNFVPSDGGMGAVFLAQPTQAFIKIDDHVVPIPLAANAGPLPQGAHTRYAGPLYAATLVPVPGGKHTMIGAVPVFAGHLTITDAKAQVVYDATGDTQCRPG
jgi:hypothetical protein